MTGAPGYTAYDLARHELSAQEAEAVVGETTARITVAQAIVKTCLVGYGGHYGEVLEDDSEGEALQTLAELLAPLYRMDVRQAYGLLERVRLEWTRRMSEAADFAAEAWQNAGWFVEFDGGYTQDDCPACGRRIKDHDMTGCEAPDGQRWCVEHALEALASYRGSR